MTRKLILSALCLFFTIVCFAQKSTLISAECKMSDVVKLQINLQSNSKKTLEADALIAAIKIVLFEGMPSTQYNKALLQIGEKTALQQYDTYFADLFENGRYTDFIKSSKQLSKFKKAENKGTLFEVEVKILQLRKDLEGNRILTKIGY